MSEQSRGHCDNRQAEPATPPDDSSIRQLQPSARSMIEAELPLKRRDGHPPLQGDEASVPLKFRQHRRIPSEDGEVSDVDQPTDSCATHNELPRDGHIDPNYPFFTPRNPLRRWGPGPDLADSYEESGATQSQVAQPQRRDEGESLTDSSQRRFCLLNHRQTRQNTFYGRLMAARPVRIALRHTQDLVDFRNGSLTSSNVTLRVMHDIGKASRNQGIGASQQATRSRKAFARRSQGYCAPEY